jgi:hypothetical protein
VAVKKWEQIQVRYCHRVQTEVSLDAEMIFAAEWMPDQPPQVVAHRCSHAFACNMDGRPSCVWAGTNPAYDPFIEPEEPTSEK